MSRSLALAASGLLAFAAGLGWPSVLAAQEAAAPQPVAELTVEQMFDLSDAALARGDESLAESLLEALTTDPQVIARNEARFRLAGLAIRRNELRRAGVLLRAALDEDPDAQRIRFELARVLTMMGDYGAARSELRKVQAGVLPPEVSEMLDRFAAALRETRRFGGNIEVAFAPDSNINRATRSDTLGTIIGDFEIDEDAKAKSGLGLALRANGYFRLPLADGVNLLNQAGAVSNLYRSGAFNDVQAWVGSGPEFQLPTGRLQFQGSFRRRWYGGDRLTDTFAFDAAFERPLGRTAQVRLTAQVAREHNAMNRLQDATLYSLSGTFDKALTQRSGIGFTLTAGRQDARDPGYSAWYGQASLFGWLETGGMTLFASGDYTRYVADERLAIYPERRNDKGFTLTAAATARQLTVAGFAPQVRVLFERNSSPIEIYSYSRVRAEIGIRRAF